MNDKLIKLEHFFTTDVKLKNEMNNLCPPSNYLDEESIIKYLDDAFESFRYIFSELKCIASDFFIELLPKIDLLEKTTLEVFIQCGTDIEKLKNAYRVFVSDMNIQFLDSVKDECVGYKYCGVNKSIEYANTINEILHLMHSYIINNDDILEAIPEINKKINVNGEDISLRGKNNSYFEQIFNYFPIQLDCGTTDLIVINDNKMLMMVRDRGHALTIEITLNRNIARVEYFIPKLCNIEMINKLPGINKVNEDSVGATGVIEIDQVYLSQVLFDFISKVPTDNDMIYGASVGRNY